MLPTQLAELVMAALALRVEERISTATEFADRLDTIINAEIPALTETVSGGATIRDDRGRHARGWGTRGWVAGP
jgi:hypothetical protein